MIVPSVPVHAQFKTPTKEELEMTSDPKAPGAAAVYLDREEITNDPLHYRSVYVRIKVLQEKGKDLSTVQIPYERGSFKVKEIKGRTIHPDGTVIPMTVKPEDLLVSKDSDQQVGKMVFNLPSAEVGCILEYRYQLTYDDNHYSSPYWQIQQPYYVHHAHYEFTPFKAFMKGIENQTSDVLIDSKGNAVNSLLWWSDLPPGAQMKTDVIGHYKLDVTDIPAIPDEDWMPPIDSLLYRVFFYYKSAVSGTDFWVTEAKRWSKDVDHFANPSKGIKQAVAGIIAPGDSDLVMAQKLYKAVQALENTDFTRTKGQAELKQLGLHESKRAEDTWKQKSGSSEDIALLYLAMLRAAGITAYDMKIVNRDGGTFLPGYLDFDQLDDDVILAMIDGKQTALDPGEKMCPFEMMHWKHAGASGIMQADKGNNVGSTQLLPYNKNSLMRIGDFTLDDHGTATGNFRFIMTGQDALRWRQAALQDDPDELKKSFDRWLEAMVPTGMEGHLDHFLGIDDEDVNLVAIVKVHGTLGTATSKRLLLPGFFFQTRAHQPFVAEANRIEPVDMHYGEKITDEIVYHLPAGFTVEGAPQNAKFDWQHQAAFADQTVVAPGQVTEARQMLRGFTFVKPTDYTSLREFYQEIGASDHQQLVLLASSTAKGN